MHAETGGHPLDGRAAYHRVCEYPPAGDCAAVTGVAHRTMSRMKRFVTSAALALLWCCGVQAAAALDVNTATRAQLEQLRGIGVAMSEKLLAERARQPFESWADLLARVPGVGPRGAARLSGQGLRVGEQAYEPPPSR